MSRNSGEVQRFYLLCRPEEITEREGSPKTACILLIEDNPADVLLVREALQEHAVRCELILITNGERATEFIQGFDASDACGPDLVILDLNLPRKSGFFVLEHIRASEACNHVPVVILSSSDSYQDKSHAAALGASHYIRKPSRLAEFMQLGSVFRELLGGRSK
ncbi:MAG TPA: response regulator [Bryobacteraceae bacterium]|nr:response regulator [Bryobacteraceae bacterium]